MFVKINKLNQKFRYMILLEKGGEERSSNTGVAFLHESNWPELANNLTLETSTGSSLLATCSSPPAMLLMPCSVYLPGSMRLEFMTPH